jgi:hypothetical protein
MHEGFCELVRESMIRSDSRAGRSSRCEREASILACLGFLPGLTLQRNWCYALGSNSARHLE